MNKTFSPFSIGQRHPSLDPYVFATLGHSGRELNYWRNSGQHLKVEVFQENIFSNFNF